MEKSKVDKLKEMMKAKKQAQEARNQRPGEPRSAEKSPPVEQTSSEQPSNMDEMTAQIKAAEDEAKAHYDKLLRVMAEFENFKKRIEKEQLEHARYSNQSLICDLLPVLDDFGRILDHISKEPKGEATAIIDGVKITQKHFLNALSKHGLTPIESALGKPFDPSLHEAVAHIESAEYPEEIVAQEHRRGWRLHDRIIRAATVVVSKGSCKP